jgi:tRNA(fMet)-specific endonuclease VapC
MTEARYLLDTNIISYLIRSHDPGLDRRMERASGQLAISAITEAELRFGLARRPQAPRLRELIEEALKRVTVLSWDSAAALVYAELRAELERGGRVLEAFDMLIAAHALAVGAILVTADKAFVGVKKLKIENWAS